MANPEQTPIPKRELTIIRDLAKRIREIAECPLNQERRRLWTAHNDLHPERPMVLIEMWGVMGEMMPELHLVCEHPRARGIEHGLRAQIYGFEQIRDDHVVSGWADVNWQVGISDYGVKAEFQRPETGGRMGSYTWTPPLQDFPKDLDKLKPRTFSVNREATLRAKAETEELYAGILPVRIRGGFYWTLGMTWAAINLIGLEQLMLYMVDQPEGLHQLMAFLRDDHLALTTWLEREGLYTLNNENDYVGSGSCGFTTQLPQPDLAAGAPARRKDLWALSESQETVGVGPRMFAEFIFPYQLAVIEKFGFCYYGCCEPIHSRWSVLQQLPNLRKVSVSPWCDENLMAAAMGNRYNYCRKPNPTLISTPKWDEDAILADLRTTLRIAGPCNVEFAMKDVHTVSDQPWRLARWVYLARQAIAEYQDGKLH